MTGTIKKVTDKGFGFISDTKGQEYFFHQSGACKVSALTTCAKVSPSSSMSARGRKAHEQKTSASSVDSPKHSRRRVGGDSRRL